MNDPISRERQLFEAAFELPIEERRRFLEQELHDEPELLARLSELLEISDSTSHFMKTDGGLNSDTSSSYASETWGPGSVIGRYTLRELLGEGGFGLVYLAEQTEPIRRLVALKIIKPGMESRELVGRLEAERQALALMEHPNIAKALDAGATESGQPYFVMELVPGAPVVFLHGMNVWSYVWRGYFEPLSNMGRRVIALDLPGLGFSDIINFFLTNRTLNAQEVVGYNTPYPDGLQFRRGQQAASVMEQMDPGGIVAQSQRLAWKKLQESTIPLLIISSDDGAQGSWGPKLRSTPGAQGQPHRHFAGEIRFPEIDYADEVRELIVDFVESID